jgi:hypothetical protein
MCTFAIPTYEVIFSNSSESMAFTWSNNSLALAVIHTLLAETAPT